MSTPRFARLTLGSVLASTVALATTIIPHTLRQRAEQADRVALVQVLSQRVEETPGAVVPLKTYTQVSVGSDFVGTGPQVLTIVQLGGVQGLTSLEVPGDARFHVGETAVVFLRCKRAVDRCHLVALGAGKLDVTGERALVEDLRTHQKQWLPLAEVRAQVRGEVRK